MNPKKPRDPRDDPNRKRHINNSRVAGKESYESKPVNEPVPPSRVFFDERTGVATRGGVPLRAPRAQGQQQQQQQQGGGVGERVRGGQHVAGVGGPSGSRAPPPQQQHAASQPSSSRRVGTKRPWEADSDEEDVPYHPVRSAEDMAAYREQIRLSSRQVAAQRSLALNPSETFVGDINAPFQPVRTSPPPSTMAAAPDPQQRFNPFVADKDTTPYHLPRPAATMTAAPLASGKLSASAEDTQDQEGDEEEGLIGEQALEDENNAEETGSDVHDSFHNITHFFEGATTAADVQSNLETFFNAPLRRIFVGSRQAVDNMNTMAEHNVDMIDEYEVANEALGRESTNLANQLRVLVENGRRLEEERRRQRIQIENLEKTVSNQAKGRH